MLSDKIREQRMRNGITQKQLAELVGMMATCVFNWERGAYLPDSIKLKKIAEVLRTISSYLLGELDDYIDNGVPSYDRDAYGS